MLKKLKNIIGRIHPTLLSDIKIDGDFLIINNLDEHTLISKELEEITFKHFEGIIKELEFCVVEEFRYITVRPIKEKAVILT